MGFFASMKSLIAGRTNDSFVDRLNRQHSSRLFLFLACYLLLEQQLGKPIECWSPSQFTENHVRFANSICWVSNYYLQVDESDRQPVYNHHQWTAVFFLLQSFLIHVPHLLWRFALRKNSANAPELFEAADKAGHTVQLEMREKAISHIVSRMESYIIKRRRPDPQAVTTFSRRRFCISGCFLSVIYLFIKTIYLINAPLQLLLIGIFLGNINGYLFHGLFVLEEIIRGKDWYVYSTILPKIILCDFEMRMQSRIHAYTVQCILNISYITGKILTVIWFWFCILTIVTFVDLLKWIVINSYTPGSISYVSKKLAANHHSEMLAAKDKNLLSRFVRNHLGPDGTLIIRLISCNYGEMTASDALDRLWSNYEARHSERGYFDSAPAHHKSKEAAAPAREILRESDYV